VLDQIAERVGVCRFKSGEYAFRQGEPSKEALFVIVRGLVEILVTSERGAESVVGLRKPGDFFSETVVLSSQNYPGSARAKEDTLCLLINRFQLERLIYNYPDFSSYFNVLLTERMRRLYENVLTDQNYGVSGGFDLPLVRKRVSEIMTTQVVTCSMADLVVHTARRMKKADSRSAVVLDHDAQPLGIVTQTQMVDNLICRQICPIDQCTAGEIMASDFQTISPQSFIGEAVVAFTRTNTKYLVVLDQSRLVGILTPLDLIQSRNMGNLTLLQDLESQESMDDLVGSSSEIDGVLQALLQEGAKVPDILEVMSELHERLTLAVIRVAEAEMVRKGLGPPPLDYCWINMGSDARHEQTLRTDQDNAMIYADPEKGKEDEVDAYFKTLAELVVDGLDRCGFTRCTGNVMASNPVWRRSLGNWLDFVESWKKSREPGDILTMTILLDFRPVWGNQSLAQKLWEGIFQVFDDPEKINHMLMSEDMRFSSPLTLLGKIKTEGSGPHKDQINIKKWGLVHLINGIRLFAVNNKITEPSTLGRLARLEEMEVISPKNADLFRTAFETLVMFSWRALSEILPKFSMPRGVSSGFLIRRGGVLTI